MTKKLIEVLDVYMEGCGPCKIVSKVFDELSEEVDDINFIKIDVAGKIGGELATKYKVRGVPTTLFVGEDGELVADSIVGASPNYKQQVMDIINQYK